jgi:TP901 family phage tail tape measure protein
VARSVDLIARLVADSRGFKKGMDEAALSAKQGEQKIRSIGRDMEALGKNLTRSVTLPILAIGAAATKTFLDFDQEITKIGSLVRDSAEGLDDLADGVKRLATETGRGPQELASALFAIESAGLQGAEGMAVLEQAAKGAAAGLGDTRDIALVGVSAQQAYGKANLEAGTALDILAKTAKEGNFEVSELSAAVSKVVPTASAAKVSFDQVGAAIAIITRQGASASDAVTRIDAAIKSLNAPTARAIPLVKEVFGSLENLRDILQRPDGLRVAFEQIGQTFGDQPELMRRMLGSSEALLAVQAHLASSTEDLDGVYGSLADNADAVDNAFAIWGETAGAQMQKAMQEIAVSLRDIGEILAPIAANIASFTASTIGLFSALPQGAQVAVVAFAGIAAAVGPVLTLMGKFAEAFPTVSAFMANHVVGLRQFKVVLGAAGIAAAGAATSVALWNKMMDDGKRRAQEFGTAIRGSVEGRAAQGFDELTAVLGDLRVQWADLQQTATSSRAPWDADFRNEVRAGADELAALEEEFNGVRDRAIELAHATDISYDAAVALTLAQKELGLESTPTQEALEALRGSLSEEEFRAVADAMGLNADQADILAGAMGGTADEVNHVVDSLEKLEAALRAQFDPLFGAQDAFLKHEEALAKAAWQTAEFGAGSTEAMEANRELARSALNVDTAMIRLRAAVEKGDVSMSDMVATLDRWVDEGLLTRDAADEATEAMGGLVWRAAEANSLAVDIPVELTGFAKVISEIDELARRAAQPLIFTASVRAREEAAKPPEFDKGGIVPGPIGSPQLVLAHGGETILPTHKGGGFGAAGGVLTVEVPVYLDGRKVGGSRTVIDGMDSARRISDRNGAR